MEHWLSKLWNAIGREIIAVGLIFLIYIILYFACHKILSITISKFVKKTKNSYDDILLSPKFLKRASLLIPFFIIPATLSLFISAQEIAYLSTQFSWLVKIKDCLIPVFTCGIITALIDSFVEIYQHFKISKHRPIKGYGQLIKIVVWIATLIFIASALMGKSPWKLLAGLGAVSAVLLMIFKDTILGLTASFQLTMNDMIRVGDWIVLPGKCDGDVIDISLHTVKVQNWDKTISTVPTYALINESFVNWRGMSEAAGRRIKRSINIDMNSIKFLDEETTKNLLKVNLLKDYLKGKLPLVSESNSRILEDAELTTNQRRLTNIGTFRIYIENFLKTNPMINRDMTFLVRQLQPTSEGLPLEIYIFCKDKVWANYEAVQADIFDHLLAIIPEFDLRVYQSPTGFDFNKIR